MANVKKIKLPNNTTVDIIDSRIPGVDTTVTSESSNVVTSGAVYTAISNSQAAAENAKSITYSNLKTAKTGGSLVPGTWYRITDYVATTIDTESRSANHPFDVIVLAESTNTLSEEGYAALHSGDTYFASSKLEAWKVWYNIDNDTTRFAWADSTNGKGVIYRMIDEFQNDLPFDFKGIQFKRYKIDDIDIKYTQTLRALVVEEAVQTYLDTYVGLSVTANKFIIDSSDYKWFYAFTHLGSTWTADIADASIGSVSLSTHNTVRPTTSGKLQSLTNVVFARGEILATCGIIDEYENAAAIHNCFFAEGSTQLSIFGHAANNRSGGQFRRNIILGFFRHNTIASDVQNNEFCAPVDFAFNDFGDLFEANSIVGYSINSGSGTVYSNRFESQFRDNIILASDFSYNVFNSIFRRNKAQHNVFNFQGNEFGVVYDTEFQGSIRFNVTNGYMKNCFLKDVTHCQFLGNLQYVDCEPNSSENDPSFTGVMVKGPLAGTSSAYVSLRHTIFSLGASNTTNRAVAVESNSDGEIIASWRNADGNEVGMYATIAETESNSWHDLAAKQDVLVSGTNIKTINNQSLLGSGNISISGGGGSINGVKENGTTLTPDANGVVDVTVPVKTYVIETDYEHWDENSYTITTQMFDAIVDDALEGRSVVLRFHIIGSDEGYNEVCDYALTYSSSSNNYWALQFNELRGGNSGRVLFLSKEGGTVQHVLYSYTFEMVGNRVTSISSYSTNYTYPTAKAVYDSVKNLAPKASPALTGTPTAPTATAGTNTTQIATTAFVQSAFTDSRTIAAGNWTFDDTNVWFDGGSYLISHYTNSADFSWIKNQTGSDSSSTYITLQDALDAKQATLVSGTNIKTINNESILGSGNISVGGGGSTTDCVHKTGDETVGGDKTFTDDIAVVDASHIKYSGGGGGGGFTKGVTSAVSTSTTGISFSVSGEPKAFVMSFRNASAATASTAYIIAVVGDSTGTHAVYTTGTQNNYSSGFTTSYSNGNFTITAPTGISFPGGGLSYSLVYYYGSGTLTFKTAQVQPGSGATSVTFTDANLTEMPEMYATMLESQVNNESYRRVSLYTNAGSDGLGDQQALGVSFFSSNIYDTTSNFTASYSNGLLINSGGVNAGGYFHNPGTYTLYYLMASDIGGGGGSYQSLAAELSAITTDISALETGKQDTLVSGTSIKTINSTSLLGSGNIAISSLPTVTTTNNGQLLEVSNGAWATGRKITISSSEPTSATGNNGDIWIVI